MPWEDELKNSYIMCSTERGGIRACGRGDWSKMHKWEKIFWRTTNGKNNKVTTPTLFIYSPRKVDYAILGIGKCEPHHQQLHIIQEHSKALVYKELLPSDIGIHVKLYMWNAANNEKDI